ncbi:alpha-mannosidase 2 [Prunus yedoensis var. nudiflora]|uniref:Alpha-mannosidase 2 n=1 Tax=Prunus yedoensis var. nudiflora TaxID=2094558 RepID=A0A314XP57_PRUYE|nr:alpha-mannosidase 2 [Prunus yedoensis var. nudiflora]
MAFSSYIGSTRRGGWANSPPLLFQPQIQAHQKAPQAIAPPRLHLRQLLHHRPLDLHLLLPRRHPPLRRSQSPLLPLQIQILHPFPKPRKSASRKPVSAGDSASDAAVGATVDITTKELYDKIEFSDVDGGPWKQGWRVSYKGDEWDSEKLKVIVVPHSHNDPGWKLTVEEYYERQSRHILDTIVDTLSKDTRRKFIWEEMSYLERWWRDSSDLKRESFTNLVKNGQLEIVGGGWVMNDEANSHYYAIIEQMTEGNMWLNDTVGVIPKNAWAIDPFGYSPTMAYLLRRMGFENMLIQRTHYELKKELALHKNLEYVAAELGCG